MADIIVGIDLGTTYSAIAFVNEQGRPEVIRTAAGGTTTPSVVLIEGGRIDVGEIAMNQWIVNEEHVVRWIKRSMGDLNYTFQGLNPVQISAEILKALKADAERHFGQPITQAVITCPAYFNSLEVENTKEAGVLAGLNVREIVKEPTAAAVYYGMEHMSDGETVLVCDLGGGTFDATVLSLRGGIFTPLATMGDRRLGGHDWTEALKKLVVERFVDRFGEDPCTDLIADQMLYEACEQAKRDLARSPSVFVPCRYQGRVEQIEVTRDEFESRTERLMVQVVMWAQEAVAKAGCTWRDINCILLVGGSSRLRRMAPALEEASGISPVKTGEPDLMVAYGAAIIARGAVRPRKAAAVTDRRATPLTDVAVKRIIARSLGTRIVVREAGRPHIVNAEIIRHSTEAPVSCSRDDFAVAYDGQPHFDVPVVEFESEDDKDVLFNCRFTCAAGARKGDRITVTFNYDESGIVTAQATDRRTGQVLPMERRPYEEPSVEEVSGTRLAPQWVAFSVDTSGSMAGTKLSHAKDALIENARKLLTLGGGQCRVGIVSFDSYARVVCDATTDLAAVGQAVEELYATGTTAMDEGIRLAVGLVEGAPAGVDRVVVMLTDGMPDSHRRQSTLAAAGEARHKGVTLAILGVGEDDVDSGFLSNMSPITLTIDANAAMDAPIGTLLTRAESVRAGVTDAAPR